MKVTNKIKAELTELLAPYYEASFMAPNLDFDDPDVYGGLRIPRYRLPGFYEERFALLHQLMFLYLMEYLTVFASDQSDSTPVQLDSVISDSVIYEGGKHGRPNLYFPEQLEDIAYSTYHFFLIGDNDVQLGVVPIFDKIKNNLYISIPASRSFLEHAKKTGSIGLGAYNLNDDGSVNEYQHYQNVSALNYEVTLGLSSPVLDDELKNTLSGRPFSRLPNEIQGMNEDEQKNRDIFMKIRPEFINNGLHIVNACHIEAAVLSLPFEERFKLMITESDNSKELLLRYEALCQKKSDLWPKIF